MSRAYAAVPFASVTCIGRRPGSAVDRIHAYLLGDAAEAAFHLHVRRAGAAPAAASGTFIQPWRRTSTAAVRCLASMEGDPVAVARPATLAALPQRLADHELARFVQDWVEGHFGRGITWHAVIHSPLRPCSRALHRHLLVSCRQG